VGADPRADHPPGRKGGGVMETDDPFDLEKFRLRPEDLKAYTG
jgi:hypothetical protein